MKFPFTVVEQGLTFIFERTNCGEVWQETGRLDGGPREKYLFRKCFGPWKFIGKGYSANYSQRVGVCRKHKANAFTIETIQEWRDDPMVQKHVAAVRAHLWEEVDRKDLEEELGFRTSSLSFGRDGVQYNKYKNTYSIHYNGLTREDAINLYKMADSIRAEKEEK